ncbi:DUF4167 domain-containing protein [Rhodovulum sulfidophilum]|uniref:DUF4167 domain-containing protein n=1 Tax=Rhodovulum sulfidophilum TaxID=35806 RepID=UPI0019286642|nr:DUF4167 domain-containing protein [Rhodovulum sulfidophilum]MBL3586125.1 DUF4167 domain-containing protein [Rhodovulum sulfidophilum]
MRPSKSRSRSKSNRSRSMGNIVNRVFDSSGPEGKVRGTPQQIIEKYNQLARDAQLANDRVAAENFQQHAEHYARLLGEAQREQEARREQQEAQQPRNRDRDDSSQNSNDESDQPTSQAGSGSSGGADVIDMSGDDGRESTLVETPEEKPAPKPRRPRKPRAVKPKGEAAEADPTGGGEGKSGEGKSGGRKSGGTKSDEGKRDGGDASAEAQPGPDPQREAPAAE